MAGALISSVKTAHCYLVCLHLTGQILFQVFQLWQLIDFKVLGSSCAALLPFEFAFPFKAACFASTAHLPWSQPP